MMDDLRTCLICGAEEQPMTHCALCGNRPPLIESVRFELKIIAEDLIAGFGDRTALLAKCARLRKRRRELQPQRIIERRKRTAAPTQGRLGI